jgi:hypothetical protein
MHAHLLPLAFSLLAFSVFAEDGPDHPSRAAEADLTLEPCINGAVSPSGTFPSQAMEEQIDAYIAWSGKTGQPYYLFRAAGVRLAESYPQR